MIELQKMVGRNTAVLNPEGRSIETIQVEKNDSPMQIYGCSDDEEGADLNCSPNLFCTVCELRKHSFIESELIVYSLCSR